MYPERKMVERDNFLLSGMLKKSGEKILHSFTVMETRSKEDKKRELLPGQLKIVWVNHIHRDSIFQIPNSETYGH